MRRLLTACAVTVLSLAALGLAVFALGIQVPSVLAGAPAEVWQSAVAIIAPAAPATQSIAKAPAPAKAIVVAQGVVARTVAHDEQNQPLPHRRSFSQSRAGPGKFARCRRC